jgi:hypothetical protein
MSLYAQQLGFAAGTLIATQLNPATGIATPVKFGILQDCSLDLSADMKELYGQNRYAIALAPGKTKVELKAKFAQISGLLFNATFFGVTETTTQTLFADSEPATLPATPPCTVTALNGAKLIADEGVFYQATGLPLAAASVLGAAAGVYTQPGAGVGTYGFDSLDAGAAVMLNYLYSSTVGQQISITNPKMGVGPAFSVVLSQPFDGRQVTYTFPLCQASKLSFPTKQDDFTILEIDFQVAANAAGLIGTINSNL